MGPWSPRPHGLQPTNWRPLAVGAPPQTHTVQGPHSAPCAPEHKVYASLISMSGRKRVGGVSGTHTWRNTTILGTPQPSAPSPEWGFEKYEEPGPGEVLPKGVVSSVGSAGFFPDRPPSRRRLGGFKGLPRPENCKQHSKLLYKGGAARLNLAAQPNALGRVAEQEIRT